MAFFVLSGFVIAYAAETRDPDARAFALSRLARLLSVTLPALALTAALDRVGADIFPALYADQWRDAATQANLAVAPAARFAASGSVPQRDLDLERVAGNATARSGRSATRRSTTRSSPAPIMAARRASERSAWRSSVSSPGRRSCCWRRFGSPASRRGASTNGFRIHVAGALAVARRRSSSTSSSSPAARALRSTAGARRCSPARRPG